MGRKEKEKWAELNDRRIKHIYLISSYGNLKNKNTGKYISPFKDKDGYLKYTLQGINGKKVKKFAHVLVAETFIGEKPGNNYQVNHKNFNKSYNYYKNLEWITQHENILHSTRHHRQTILSCQAHGYSTMTNDLVEKICQMIASGMKNKEIINSLGYTKNDPEYELFRGRIKHIRNKNTWRPISDKYF